MKNKGMMKMKKELIMGLLGIIAIFSLIYIGYAIKKDAVERCVNGGLSRYICERDL